MNVAVRLASLGIRSSVISAVGMDQYGDDLLSLLRDRSVDASLVQRTETIPTGTVRVSLLANGSPTFDIVEPAAWDAIDFSEAALTAVHTADAFVFGSLAARHESSRRTLLRLVHESTYAVFDVNLRPPFIDRALIDELLRHTDLVKMNDEELRVLGGNGDERSLIEECAERYGIETVCVTRGEHGAIVFHRGEWAEHPGFSVTVADTVGAGDSFLAGFLEGMMRGIPLLESLTRACALGALVASRKGATPFVASDEIIRMTGVLE